jgi:N-acetylglucosaminyl-diphospho-decaprenol L-rhamnosyltransferase
MPESGRRNGEGGRGKGRRHNRSIIDRQSSIMNHRSSFRLPPSAFPPPPAAVGAPDVDIGVVYTYEDELMPRLLSTLRESGDGLDMRLILVDNNSRPGAGPWMEYFANTMVLRNPKRLGYCANLNRILAASSAPYVLLLNTDMYFDPAEQCITKMARFMQRQPDCGIAGCRLHHEDGGHAPSARRFQTLSMLLARRFGLGGLMQRTLDRYFYRERAIQGSWQCDWLSGCFLMIRREAFQHVGFFDARFVKYFEDVDMCLRMAGAGWRVMYHGGTYCYHAEQRGSQNLFSADARKHLRSYVSWLRKWGFSPERARPVVGVCAYAIPSHHAAAHENVPPRGGRTEAPPSGIRLGS